MRQNDAYAQNTAAIESIVIDAARAPLSATSH
jgi:hypothetical protein